MDYATKENVYICLDCGSKTTESDLQGVKNDYGYYELFCGCGSKNIENAGD